MEWPAAEPVPGGSGQDAASGDTAATADTGPPTYSIGLNVRVPNDDKALINLAKSLGIYGTGPGLAADAVFAGLPFAPNGGKTVPSPAMPGGAGRQFRVEAYAQTEPGAQAPLARGLTVPSDLSAATAATQRTAYLTRPLTFSAVYDDTELTGSGHKTTLPTGRAALGAIALPSNQVLIVGGGTPGTSPFDKAGYSDFSSAVWLYDPDARTLKMQNNLATPRAFHTLAIGQTVVAIVGGAEMSKANLPHSSNKIEFYNLASGELTSVTQSSPNLQFGRVAPTVVQMFEHQDYFLVLGGEGDEACPDKPANGLCAGNTWEIWHPIAGRQAWGQLATARWHHAGVRIPGPNGGFVMLIGGENAQGPVTNMEVLQFTVSNSSVLMSDALTKCPAECPATPANFLWNPAAYPNQPARIWPAALFVAQTLPVPFYHVYIVGGFDSPSHAAARKNLDIFEISPTTSFLPGVSLAQGRAAPLVAAVTSGPSAGQVLIAGGSTSDNVHLATGEFLRVVASGGKTQTTASSVANGLTDGDRTLGAAVGLVTGHVLLVGGVGKGGTPRTELMLWHGNWP